MAELPSGTLTFLFTDIEGSTARWERAPEAMRIAIARHDALFDRIIAQHGGYLFKRIGDAICAAFAEADVAARAALAAQQAVAAELWGDVGPIRVRMALQTGRAELRDSDYFGQPLNRVARLLATAHGGQVLLALPTAELARDNLPSGASLRDLGEHRLKDLIRPERVFQLMHPLLAADFPPIRSLDARPHNLPVQLAPLIGREREVAEISALLSQPDLHLLTLIGPGGVGKTRLALQVAAEAIDAFEDGVFFVPLTAVRERAQVVSAIAEQLDIRDDSGTPIVEVLEDRLRGGQALIVLDNFEQVLVAADLVSELLASCPGLKILVTSRAVLRVYGEHVVTVPPLSLPEPSPPAPPPTPESLSQYESVRLFIQRAQAVQPGFRVTAENAPAVAEICHRLDGLPLAIELAAARSRLLTPEAILARLGHRLQLLTSGARDRPARQQTLRGAIDWSYELLDEEERRLFRALSVFAGGFSLEAAEQVGSGQSAVGSDQLDVRRSTFDEEPSTSNVQRQTSNVQPPLEVLDGVSSLVDKSLLRVVDDDAQRFTMLGTIREYAAEQLVAAGEDTAVRRRHAELFADLVDEANLKLQTPDQLVWLRRLATEQDNIRAALAWLEAAGEVEGAVRIAGSFWWFWWLGGHVGGGHERLAALLNTPGPRTLARARGLLGLGMLTWLQNDYQSGRAALAESAEIFGEHGADSGRAYAMVHLAQSLLLAGETEAGQPLADEAEALARNSGDQFGLANLLLFRSIVGFRTGDFERAQACAEESLRLFRAVGGPISISMPLHLLGGLALQRGDLVTARSLLTESVELRRGMGNTWECAHLLNSLGDVERAAGDSARARTCYEESLSLFQRIGATGGAASSLHNLGFVALQEGDPERAAPLLLEGARIFEERDDQRGVAECLLGFAMVALRRGRDEQAARLIGACDALLASAQMQIWHTNRDDYEQAVAAVRAQLGGAVFASAHAEGAALAVRAAIAEAAPLAIEQ